MPVTSGEEFVVAVEAGRAAFQQLGLHAAWQRVFAVVVQLGANFSDQTVFDYDPAKTRQVCEAARQQAALVLEVHSTDYQLPGALKRMVEDGAAVLKVGPALTFTLRESLFALECIEQELAHRLPEPLSRLRHRLDRAMLKAPPETGKIILAGRNAKSVFHGCSAFTTDVGITGAFPKLNLLCNDCLATSEMCRCP